ncbi:hypothetical protein F5878DRAFT_31813 [Lentinula raphanica]|uniref:Secreted protein n=1 Tax=Lentinula raphanica TaxID=153919 RepID=A0AA38PDV4_9AGAR|nr:hypothetical protein F5878DRAFT_31813 [Lentinula raphanica]
MARFVLRAILVLGLISSGVLAAPTSMPRSSVGVQDLQSSDPAIGGPPAVVNVLEPRGNGAHSAKSPPSDNRVDKKSLAMLQKLFRDNQQRAKDIMDLAKSLKSLRNLKTIVLDQFPGYVATCNRLMEINNTLQKLLEDVVDWSSENTTNGFSVNAVLQPGNSDDRLSRLVSKLLHNEEQAFREPDEVIDPLSSQLDAVLRDYHSISGREIQRQGTE